MPGINEIVQWMRDERNGIPLTDNRDQLEKYREVIADFFELKTSAKLIDEAILKYISRLDFVMPETSIVVDHDQVHDDSWVAESLKLDRPSWNRLRLFLLEKRKRDERSVCHLDEESEIVLRQLGNPKSPKTSKRGLVVGYVQSGKTANMAAVMAKAADSGYRIIIVFAGVLDSLRQQTQRRFDEELTGGRLDTFIDNWAHVPRVQYFSDNDLNWRCGTFCNPHSQKSGDIEKRPEHFHRLGPNGGPALFVIKKNPRRLKILKEALQSSKLAKDGQIYFPALIIDDESDQATINIKAHKDEIAGTNRAIRELLNTFSNCTYLGYTATPFANILIDPNTKSDLGEDLFPRDFIITLSPPKAYLGAKELFGVKNISEADEDESMLPIVNYIPEEEAKLMGDRKSSRNIDIVANESSSLRGAINSFILSSACRVHRGHANEDMSMLIHPSSYTNIQNRLYEPVHAYLTQIKALHNTHSLDRKLKDVLKKIWENDFLPKSQEIRTRFIELPILPSFEVLEPLICDILREIEIKVLHSGTNDYLQYLDPTQPKRYIIIGGNKLSRGLTLEGLSVSYFTRSSKAYDTLLQMGRWFGYRRHYVDLTRLYMRPSAADAFAQLAFVEMDLRDQFKNYQLQGVKPLEMPPKIVKLPALTITGANRIGAGTKVELDFSSQVVQQVNFNFNDTNSIKNQNEIINNFIASLGAPAPAYYRNNTRPKRGSHIWLHAVGNEIIIDLIAKLNLENIQKQLFVTYLKDRMRDRKWFIAIAGKEEGLSLGTFKLGDQSKEIVAVNRQIKSANIPTIRSLYSKGELEDVIHNTLAKNGIDKDAVGILTFYFLNSDPKILWPSDALYPPPKSFIENRPSYIIAPAFSIPKTASGVVKVSIPVLEQTFVESDDMEVSGDE